MGRIGNRVLHNALAVRSVHRLIADRDRVFGTLESDPVIDHDRNSFFGQVTDFSGIFLAVQVEESDRRMFRNPFGSVRDLRVMDLLKEIADFLKSFVTAKNRNNGRHRFFCRGGCFLRDLYGDLLRFRGFRPRDNGTCYAEQAKQANQE